MEVEFANKELEQIATEAHAARGFSPGVVKAYRKRLQLIKSALDERDFYAMKSLHYEKLQGKRAHQRSMRLNRQWRLVIEVIDGKKGNTVRVISIEDYH